MITIQYFASIRERLARASDELPLPEAINSVAELIAYLGDRDADFAALAKGDEKLLVAVNQTVVDREHRLCEGDEVAFFPPMTGG